MKIVIKNTAKKYISRIQEPYKSNIIAAIEGLAEKPPKGDTKALTGQKEKWRLRIGGIRIIYTIQNEIVFVTHIGPRGQAYTKKTKEK